MRPQNLLDWIAFGLGRSAPGSSRRSGWSAPWMPVIALLTPGLLLVASPAGLTGQDGTGSLEGIVTLGGSERPTSTRVENSTDPDICGVEHSLQDMEVAPQGRGVRYVAVSLTGLAEDQIPDSSPGRLVIDNRDCKFDPHVAVASLGDTIVARNSDPTLHNTHYYGPMRSNIALAVEGMSVSRVAHRPGLVTILCDVHGWMKAYLRIDPHPYHAVTDPTGEFRIDGVPAGRQTLEVWHDRLGAREVDVEIVAGETTTIEIEYPPETD